VSRLFNANTRSAYQAGYYTGTFTIADILTHGDTGLGALDGNDGELLIQHGVAWRTTADGTTHRIDAKLTSPFTTVIDWHTEVSFTLDQPLGKDAFETELASRLPLTNRIWALQHPRQIPLGHRRRQRPATPPLPATRHVMADYQNQTWTDTTGTLIAFHCPIYLTGIDYVGAHYHWLSDDRTHGGHVADFTTADVTVEACEADSYTTQLPATDEFHDLDLTPFY